MLFAHLKRIPVDCASAGRTEPRTSSLAATAQNLRKPTKIGLREGDELRQFPQILGGGG